MVDRVAESNRIAREHRARLDPFYIEVGRIIVGQRPLVDRLVVALLTGGHVLLEGVPGLAKTLLVRTAAKAMSLSFSRIQFTPDLLPSDVIGTQVFHPKTGDFAVKRGPIFANVVLADEINRAPAKVQSALLEAMQELQVTLGDTTHPLPQPFFVLATQNPIEHEGTYPLPEAQLDRFLFKLRIDYPSKTEEAAVIDRMAGGERSPEIAEVLHAEDLALMHEFVESVYVDEKVKNYALDIVRATRSPAEYGLDLKPLIEYGAGPRASVGLVRAAKGLAMLDGRGYVTPHDVKRIAPDVLRHRVLVSYEADADNLNSDSVVDKILAGVPAP